ncbi:MAG TPA: hypothetical protein P5244_07345 [Syntrophales bacterium]|nr:hypothetical protein [Syntrophales bacterium]
METFEKKALENFGEIVINKSWRIAAYHHIAFGRYLFDFIIKC